MNELPTIKLTAKDIIKLINKSNTIQDSYWEEQEFEPTIQQIIDECEFKCRIDASEHRWYRTEVIVLSYHGELFGLNFISKLYSDTMEYRDVYLQITAHNVIGKTSIVYSVVDED